MRIERLTIHNFRGIKDLELDFSTGRTAVIVGINGAGKSSILDCTAIMLSRLIGRIRTSSGTGRFFTETDIRNGAPVTRNSIELLLEKQSTTWTVTRSRRGKKQQTIANLQGVKDAVALIVPESGLSPDTNVPLAVYYHVNRAVIDIPLRIRGSHDFDQLAAYDQALTGARNDFRIFFEWFRNREDVENEALRDVGAERTRTPTRPKAHNDRQLDAVRTAIERLLPGCTSPRVRRQPSLRMTIKKKGQELIINQLSDGEKCLLAMAGDLARRLALANPSLPNPLNGEGVVLIDEVELHLHPQWQRRIIPTLEKAFPKCQFIVTTHSPLVLSYVPREQVFLLEDFKLVPNTPHTYGRDANSLLFEVMAVPDRPDAIRDRLSRCFRLIDEDKTDLAKQELADLEELLGENDPDTIRARSMLAFLEEL